MCAVFSVWRRERARGSRRWWLSGGERATGDGTANLITRIFVSLKIRVVSTQPTSILLVLVLPPGSKFCRRNESFLFSTIIFV